jgi:hypothetical protein
MGGSKAMNDLEFALLASCAFLACSSPPRCVTPCGVVIVGEAVDCVDYARVETELLERLPVAGACETWRNTTAEAMPGRESVHLGRRVEGWSDCVWGALYFHADYPRFWRTAFAHELVHIAQRCETPQPVDEHRDADHSNWSRDGIAKALLDTQDVFMMEDARR